MTGIELSRSFYESFGAAMIHEKFPSLEPILAVGLCGSGSDCFGYDDELSRDHDFEPGFCIFVPDGISDGEIFRLERAYASLPDSFEGLKRQKIAPAGMRRRGVIPQSEFFSSRTGHPDGKLTLREWMRLPESYLAEAVNGAVFRDDAGVFTARREYLRQMPIDVRRKKLAGNLLLMSQSGKYNYPRALRRGDTAAAQLSAIEFARHAIAASFNIDGVPAPYYKWLFRALRSLSPKLAELYDQLEFIIASDNDSKTASVKSEIIDDVASAILDAAFDAGFIAVKLSPSELTRAANLCNDSIADIDARNLNILYAVD